LPILHSILKHWQSNNIFTGDFEQFYLFRAYKNKNGQLLGKAEIIKAILLDELKVLSKRQERLYQVLIERFIKGGTILSVAHSMNISQDQLNRLQKSALIELSLIFIDDEKKVREKILLDLNKRLPTKTYHTLFGIESTARDFIPEIMRPGSPASIFVIVGIGGIGKTAFADYVLRQCVNNFPFYDFIWIKANTFSAQGELIHPEANFDSILLQIGNQLFSTVEPGKDLKRNIQYLLKENPYLIVIDNLETEEHFHSIIENIMDLANPSKFIITSRVHSRNQGGLFILNLQEISSDAAMGLITDQMNSIGLNHQSVAIQDHIEDIYKTVGGNPLALKIIVGLLNMLPLNNILMDLQKVHSGDVENLYTYIYKLAWESLNIQEKQVMAVMPLISEKGATLDQLTFLSSVPVPQLTGTIDQLYKRSLLEIQGGVNEKRYGIHRLTDTFLRTNVLHWK
ncbi:MAG: hypothetical protein JXA19_07050, partial [Anaerolineales bacterium]|nr:hypothetical protein [Anaerolineales bacterium]